MAENKVDPKEIEKVQKLLSDEEFVKKLISQETVEDAKKLFEDQGITTSIEEMEMLGRFIKKISEKGNKKLSEEELTEIVGGKLNNKVNLKNAAIRTGGVIVGAYVGAIVGIIGCAPVELLIKGPSFSYKYPGTIGGAILGTISGAVAGYKIAGKWCDK